MDIITQIQGGDFSPKHRNVPHSIRVVIARDYDISTLHFGNETLGTRLSTMRNGFASFCVSRLHGRQC